MDIISPTVEDATKVLGNSLSVAHAARCGTCACKCACRYSNGVSNSPW